MLGPIRTYFFEKEKQKRVDGRVAKKPQFKRNRHNHFGLLVDAAQSDHRATAMQFAEELRKAGSQVKILGFYEGKPDQQQAMPFDIFSTADLSSMSGVPKSEKVNTFIEQPFDVLINLSIHHNHRPLEFISAASHAVFRIGPWYHHVQQSPYDLCIDTGATATLKEWISELMHTLEKIY